MHLFHNTDTLKKPVIGMNPGSSGMRAWHDAGWVSEPPAAQGRGGGSGNKLGLFTKVKTQGILQNKMDHKGSKLKRGITMTNYKWFSGTRSR